MDEMSETVAQADLSRENAERDGNCTTPRPMPRLQIGKDPRSFVW
jgi:hypothetical protein